jgi:hypothetical protein
MRRVAGALEAVELERLERVGWHDLIDDEHEPGGTRDARHTRSTGRGDRPTPSASASSA